MAKSLEELIHDTRQIADLVTAKKDPAEILTKIRDILTGVITKNPQKCKIAA